MIKPHFWIKLKKGFFRSEFKQKISSFYKFLPKFINFLRFLKFRNIIKLSKRPI
jgi:hypothetical protein